MLLFQRSHSLRAPSEQYIDNIHLLIIGLSCFLIIRNAYHDPFISFFNDYALEALVSFALLVVLIFRLRATTVPPRARVCVG